MSGGSYYTPERRQRAEREEMVMELCGAAQSRLRAWKQEDADLRALVTLSDQQFEIVKRRVERRRKEAAEDRHIVAVTKRLQALLAQEPIQLEAYRDTGNGTAA